MTKLQVNDEAPTAEKAGVKAVQSPPEQLSEADLDNIIEQLSDDAMDGIAGGEAG